jgi:hypothetical protein
MGYPFPSPWMRKRVLGLPERRRRLGGMGFLPGIVSLARLHWPRSKYYGQGHVEQKQQVFLPGQWMRGTGTAPRGAGRGDRHWHQGIVH